MPRIMGQQLDVNRFDDTRDLWRAELRVGEVLDARLKHVEERG